MRPQKCHVGENSFSWGEKFEKYYHLYYKCEKFCSYSIILLLASSPVEGWMIVRHQANPIKYGKLIDSGGENRSIRSNLVQGVKNCLELYIIPYTGFCSVSSYHLLRLAWKVSELLVLKTDREYKKEKQILAILKIPLWNWVVSCISLFI